jgi:hypothetical protein
VAVHSHQSSAVFSALICVLQRQKHIALSPSVIVPKFNPEVAANFALTHTSQLG